MLLVAPILKLTEIDQSVLFWLSFSGGFGWESFFFLYIYILILMLEGLNLQKKKKKNNKKNTSVYAFRDLIFLEGWKGKIKKIYIWNNMRRGPRVFFFKRGGVLTIGRPGNWSCDLRANERLWKY